MFEQPSVMQGGQALDYGRDVAAAPRVNVMDAITENQGHVLQRIAKATAELEAIADRIFGVDTPSPGQQGQTGAGIPVGKVQQISDAHDNTIFALARLEIVTTRLSRL